MPSSKGSPPRADAYHLFAHIYFLVGEPENALDMLEFPLKTHYFSPGRYKIERDFAPLRGAVSILTEARAVGGDPAFTQSSALLHRGGRAE